jgi:hypothetical protein
MLPVSTFLCLVPNVTCVYLSEFCAQCYLCHRKIDTGNIWHKTVKIDMVNIGHNTQKERHG